MNMWLDWGLPPQIALGLHSAVAMASRAAEAELGLVVLAASTHEIDAAKLSEPVAEASYASTIDTFRRSSDTLAKHELTKSWSIIALADPTMAASVQIVDRAIVQVIPPKPGAKTNETPTETDDVAVVSNKQPPRARNYAPAGAKTTSSIVGRGELPSQGDHNRKLAVRRLLFQFWDKANEPPVLRELRTLLAIGESFHADKCEADQPENDLRDQPLIKVIFGEIKRWQRTYSRLSEDDENDLAANVLYDCYEAIVSKSEYISQVGDPTNATGQGWIGYIVQDIRYVVKRNADKLYKAIAHGRQDRFAIERGIPDQRTEAVNSDQWFDRISRLDDRVRTIKLGVQLEVEMLEMDLEDLGEDAADLIVADVLGTAPVVEAVVNFLKSIVKSDRSKEHNPILRAAIRGLRAIALGLQKHQAKMGAVKGVLKNDLYTSIEKALRDRLVAYGTTKWVRNESQYALEILKDAFHSRYLAGVLNDGGKPEHRRIAAIQALARYWYHLSRGNLKKSAVHQRLRDEAINVLSELGRAPNGHPTVALESVAALDFLNVAAEIEGLGDQIRAVGLAETIIATVRDHLTAKLKALLASRYQEFYGEILAELTAWRNDPKLPAKLQEALQEILDALTSPCHNGKC